MGPVEVEVVGAGLAVGGRSCQGRWTSPRAPGLSPFRWRRGQQPDGHPLEGDLEEEEATLGWAEVDARLGGDSSNQTVSWIILSWFGSYVWGTDSSFVSLSLPTVLALLCTLAACGVD